MSPDEDLGAADRRIQRHTHTGECQPFDLCAPNPVAAPIDVNPESLGAALVAWVGWAAWLLSTPSFSTLSSS